MDLLGPEDPLRASVPAAIRDCKAAGIRVVMITGDYPVTAAKIAREIRLPSDTVMTGAGPQREESPRVKMETTGSDRKG